MSSAPKDGTERREIERVRWCATCRHPRGDHDEMGCWHMHANTTTPCECAVYVPEGTERRVQWACVGAGIDGTTTHLRWDGDKGSGRIMVDSRSSTDRRAPSKETP